ncbi:MAG: hypothetical protein ACJ74Z_17295, partial [Bryobacteraceae bacterium]
MQGELDQIQFLFGRNSLQTIQRYLGCKPRLRSAVHENLGLKPQAETFIEADLPFRICLTVWESPSTHALELASALTHRNDSQTHTCDSLHQFACGRLSQVITYGAMLFSIVRNSSCVTG